MTSKIKVDNIANQSDSNIVNKCGTTITLGASGDTITLACGATQTGFGRTGTVDWDTTAKTASFTAVSGNGYFVNTTSGAITVTLPATPSAGDIVAVSDYAQTAETNNITMGRNGSNIEGDASDLVIQNNGVAMTFVYADATKGWKVVNAGSESDKEPVPVFIEATGGTITTCGDFKIHTFTGPGTFCVSTISNTNDDDNIVSYTVVAGGGGGGSGGGTGGGSGAAGAGAGAGGFRENKSPVDTYTASPLEGSTDIPITVTSYPITVGAGGASSSNGGASNPGNNSIFSTITSAGGGGGGVRQSCVPGRQNGQPGGSGGGGTLNVPGIGDGNSPPVSPPQGNPGGQTSPQPISNFGGGGGGGAGASGSNATAGCSGGIGGPGGAGITTSITGSSVTRTGGGGGGGGGDAPNFNAGGSGGPGGGGAGGGTGVAGTAGTTNTGGGGGGGGSNPGKDGAAGGSGIVIIRYRYQ